MRNVFCDMDGVLVDFIGGAVPRVNEVLNNPPPELAQLAQEVREEVGRDYVVEGDLEKYTPTGSKKASELWEGIKGCNVTILTSPMDKRGAQESLEGKRIWLENNLGLCNIREVIFEHEKFLHAGEGNVLFDDFMSKVGPWRENGGLGFHFQNNAQEALAFLEEVNG